MSFVETLRVRGFLLSRTAATFVMATAVSACGGGNSSASHAVLSQNLSPVVSGHLARFNEFRSCAKLGPLSFDSTLATAAQAHADYLRLNNAFSHGETPGATSFYGAGISDRIVKAGYQFEVGTLQSETLAGGSPVTEKDGRDLADVLLGSPSHRFTILAHDFTAVGIAAMPLVSVFASPRLQSSNGIVLFPCEGLTGVNTLTTSDKALFAVDASAPNFRSGAVGYPLSLSARIVSTFKFRSPWLRMADGTSVPLKCANPEMESVSAVLCAPAAPLLTNASYEWGVEVQAGVGVWNAYKARFTTGLY